jgi:hypothetical protein
MPSVLRIPLLLGVVAIIALVVASLGYYTVEQGERGVVLRFGQVTEVAQPGLHFKIPFVDTVEMVSIRTRILDWSGPNLMHTYSRDQQPAELTVRLTYFIKPDNDSVKALYAQYGSVDNYAQAVIWPRASEQIKTTFGQFNAVTACRRGRISTPRSKPPSSPPSRGRPSPTRSSRARSKASRSRTSTFPKPTRPRSKRACRPRSRSSASTRTSSASAPTPRSASCRRRPRPTP